MTHFTIPVAGVTVIVNILPSAETVSSAVPALDRFPKGAKLKFPLPVQLTGELIVWVSTVARVSRFTI